MKRSKIVRWVLVLPAIAATFGIFAMVAHATEPGDWFAWIACSVPLLVGVMVAPAHGKRFVIIISSLFLLTCLVPPWQATNGARYPMGYGLIFNPPEKVTQSEWVIGDIHTYSQIDFGRLFVEWAALAAITGMVWVLVVKPARSSDDKEKRPQKFIPPSGNPEN